MQLTTISTSSISTTANGIDDLSAVPTVSRRNTRPRECAWVNRELEKRDEIDPHTWIYRMAERTQRASDRRTNLRRRWRKRSLERHVEP